MAHALHAFEPMLVYGDRHDRVNGRTVQEDILRALAAAEGSASGPSVGHVQLLRGDRETWLLIEIGRLIQGVLDEQFTRLGHDEDTPTSVTCGEVLWRLGRFYLSAQPDSRRSDRLRRELARSLARLEVDRMLSLREPEGFAHYGVYPEQYVLAAQAMWRPTTQFRVWGLRSIGTALAAAVSAALHCPSQPWTFRPTGHPFARELRIGPRLEGELSRTCRQRVHVVVDEGPGLSGSSFGAALAWLEERGVSAPDIDLLPSHPGLPGSAGAPSVRERYAAAHRHYVDFETLFDLQRGPDSPLARLFQDLTGSPESAPVDVGAGRWRALTYMKEHSPAAQVRDERRKYLLRAGGRTWLLKFVGLGARGPRSLERAQRLHQAGFIPALVAVRSGFGLQPWLTEAKPLSVIAFPREQLLGVLADYVSYLARTFRNRPAEAGATPRDLFAMLVQNVTALLDPRWKDAALRLDAGLKELARLHRTTATDNRMHRHEWLALSDGRVLKCDALDHHAGHDCVGCQDPSWDVAGACVEFSLTTGERERFLGELRRRALSISELQLQFYELAYLAWWSARSALHELNTRAEAPEESVRWEREKRRYLNLLREHLTRLA